MTEEDAVTQTVARNIDQLDETFLAALVAYIKAADKERHRDLAGNWSWTLCRITAASISACVLATTSTSCFVC